MRWTLCGRNHFFPKLRPTTPLATQPAQFLCGHQLPKVFKDFPSAVALSPSHHHHHHHHHRFPGLLHACRDSLTRNLPTAQWESPEARCPRLIICLLNHVSLPQVNWTAHSPDAQLSPQCVGGAQSGPTHGATLTMRSHALTRLSPIQRYPASAGWWLTPI